MNIVFSQVSKQFQELVLILAFICQSLRLSDLICANAASRRFLRSRLLDSWVMVLIDRNELLLRALSIQVWSFLLQLQVATFPSRPRKEEQFVHS